jgi:hypothetical protein
VAGNVSNWVWQHSRAVNASLIVLLAIAHEASEDGEAEMAAADLAAKCRLGERTVQTAVKELVAAGELDARHGGGRGRRTGYRLTMVNPADPAGFETVNPADPAPIPASNPADPAGFTETPQILNPADPAGFTGHRRRSRRNPAGSAPFTASDVFKRSTGSEEVQVKEASAKPPRLDAERLCQHLADRIEGNGSKRPVVTKRWLDAARLMLDNDGRTEQQIMTAIDWCQKHEFWRVNIMSMPKLREKYDALRLEAARVNGSGHKSTTNDRVQQAAEMGRRVQAMLEGDT